MLNLILNYPNFKLAIAVYKGLFIKYFFPTRHFFPYISYNPYIPILSSNII